MDAVIKYALVAGKKALQNASIDFEKPGEDGSLQLNRCGILVGTAMGGMQTFATAVEDQTTKGFRRMNPFCIPFAITNMPGALLAMDLGFMGPNYSISTACATGNYCILQAADHIRRGDADLMLAGGADAAVIPSGIGADISSFFSCLSKVKNFKKNFIFLPASSSSLSHLFRKQKTLKKLTSISGGFAACKALSQRNGEPERASRPWDQGRDGFVMGGEKLFPSYFWSTKEFCFFLPPLSAAALPHTFASLSRSPSLCLSMISTTKNTQKLKNIPEGAGVLVLESLEHARRRGAPIICEFAGGALGCDAHHMTEPRPDGSGVRACIEQAVRAGE